MYCITAHPKNSENVLWLTATGKFSKKSWKAVKIPSPYIDIILEKLESKYKTIHFYKSY